MDLIKTEGEIPSYAALHSHDQSSFRMAMVSTADPYVEVKLLSYYCGDTFQRTGPLLGCS